MAVDPITQVFDQLGKDLGRTLKHHDVSPLQEYLVEAILFLVVAAAYGGLFLALHRSAVGAGAVLFVLVMALLAVLRQAERRNPRYHFLRRTLDASRVRRRWNRAVRHCGLPHHIPIRKIERVSTGHRLWIRVGRGISFRELEQRRENLAADLGVRELQLKRDPHNAKTGTADLVRDDPLADVAGTVWPGSRNRYHERGSYRTRAYRPGDEPPRTRYVRPRKPPPNTPRGGTSLWEPIPIGTDERGEQVTLSLPERSGILGGVPGSGKSAAMSMLLATAALDPNVHIFLIDGKLVEFAVWEGCADKYAHSLDDAIDLLIDLQAIMTEHLKRLRALGKRKVEREGPAALPFYALFIDELSLFTANTDKKKASEFTTLLINLVALGRAAGIIVWAATQKPQGSVVPTELRDLFPYRFAMRCGTPQASDTILGQGWATQGYNAQTIAQGDAGVGYLLAEEDVPRRLRTFYLTDDDTRRLAEDAKRGRGVG